jgi:endonuclease/exonuclease/phosphatase family metal-dependent hydrolase
MRLLTYNIHKGIGGRDRRYRLERIISVIRVEEPDFVCLQEVDRNVRRSRHDDQPRLLSELCLMRSHCYQLNVRLKQGGYGNLLLSRWPIARSHHLSLRYAEKKPRGAQLAVVDTPEGTLCLVNWHLGLSGRERHWQCRRLLEHRLMKECNGLPTLVAGDVNDWQNRLPKRHFAGHDFHHVTSPPSRFRSFPAYLPVLALDKVFVRGAIEVERAHLVRSPLTRRASDHLPLVVDFRLIPPDEPN